LRPYDGLDAFLKAKVNDALKVLILLKEPFHKFGADPV
jgi:hypothetical protein